VELAQKACNATDSKVWKYLGTLAAAYAEIGDFPAAEEWAAKSLKLAPDDEKAATRARLALYKNQQPYRE
jgi:hypothetical protein